MKSGLQSETPFYCDASRVNLLMTYENEIMKQEDGDTCFFLRAMGGFINSVRSGWKVAADSNIQSKNS